MPDSTAAPASVKPLEPSELQAWRALKHIGESALSAVGEVLLAEVQLSGAEFGVLSRLADLGDGQLDQSELLASLRWEKSRLSHLLRRMRSRHLVASAQAGRQSRVTLTKYGEARLAAARPVHAAAVRRYLDAVVPSAEREVLIRIAHRIRNASG